MPELIAKSVRIEVMHVEDRDLFHARVKDAPAGAQARRRLFARVFFTFGAAGAFVLEGFLGGIAAVSEARASDGLLDLIGLLAPGTSVPDSACHDSLLSG